MPEGDGMIELRTPGELDAMRAASAVVADMLAAVRATAAPGIRLTQLDSVARDVLADAGAGSPFLGYAPLATTPPFPVWSACRSTTSRCTGSPPPTCWTTATC
jgi:methionyl aminopeptidase